MDMTDPKDVGAIKANLHATFDTPQGKEVLKWLEVSCGWYHSVYSTQDPNLTLINDGKRQVIATIKTFLELSTDQIVYLTKKKEG
jgi:hypothetical protein